MLGIFTKTLAAATGLAQELATLFGQHPLVPILRSAPGLGPVLTARLLAEVGDDPARFQGTALVHRHCPG